MTILLDDYSAFRRKALSVAEKAQQAKGALKQLTARLKKEFGVDSVEGAEKLLKEMKRKEAKLAKEFNELRHKFEKEYRRELGEAGKRVGETLPSGRKAGKRRKAKSEGVPFRI
jgi:DNA anti-recombination protein RmuC